MDADEEEYTEVINGSEGTTKSRLNGGVPEVVFYCVIFFRFISHFISGVGKSWRLFAPAPTLRKEMVF